jgi:hypothetical protein
VLTVVGGKPAWQSTTAVLPKELALSPAGWYDSNNFDPTAIYNVGDIVYSDGHWWVMPNNQEAPAPAPTVANYIQTEWYMVDAQYAATIAEQAFDTSWQLTQVVNALVGNPAHTLVRDQHGTTTPSETWDAPYAAWTPNMRAGSVLAGSVWRYIERSGSQRPTSVTLWRAKVENPSATLPPPQNLAQWDRATILPKELALKPPGTWPDFDPTVTYKSGDVVYSDGRYWVLPEDNDAPTPAPTVATDATTEWYMVDAQFAASLAETTWNDVWQWGQIITAMIGSSSWFVAPGGGVQGSWERPYGFWTPGMQPGLVKAGSVWVYNKGGDPGVWRSKVDNPGTTVPPPQNLSQWEKVTIGAPGAAVERDALSGAWTWEASTNSVPAGAGAMSADSLDLARAAVFSIKNTDADGIAQKNALLSMVTGDILWLVTADGTTYRYTVRTTPRAIGQNQVDVSVAIAVTPSPAFVPTAGSRVTVAWQAAGGGGPKVTVAPTAPTGGRDGDIWVQAAP